MKNHGPFTVGKDAREAVKDQAPLDKVRSLTSELQQMHASLAAHRTDEAAQEQATADAGAG